MKVFWLVVARKMLRFLSYPMSLRIRNSINSGTKKGKMTRMPSDSYHFKLEGAPILYHATLGATLSLAELYHVFAFLSYFTFRTKQHGKDPSEQIWC